MMNVMSSHGIVNVALGIELFAICQESVMSNTGQNT